MDEDDDLPAVDHPMPWGMRLLLIGLGVVALVLPAWEFQRALWPPNALTPFFAVIVVGAAGVGLLFVGAGVTAEGQRWRYLPGIVIVERTLWRRTWQTRLTARDLVAVDVRHDTSMEGPDRWSVVLVPRAEAAPVRRRFGLAAGTGYAGGAFVSPQAAEIARQALLAHLGMRGGPP